MTLERTLVMPKLGLTMTEGTLTKWQVNPGDKFLAEDVLAIIESEKAAVEVEAPAAGIFSQALIGEGESVPVGTPIAQWTAVGGDSESENSSAAMASVHEASQLSRSPKVQVPERPHKIQSPAGYGARRLITPLARRLAQQAGIDIKPLIGTGPKGRIQARDIEAIRGAMQANSRSEGTCAVTRNGPEHKVTLATAIERTMASKVTAAKQNIPHFYISADLNVDQLEKLRAQINAMQSDIHVSMTHMLVAAAVYAVKRQPDINRIWKDQDIVELQSVDIGIAVDTDRGLMNPVIRNLESETFGSMTSKVNDAIDRARTGRLKPEDFDGGAITISNAGMYRLRYMSSIIVPGQSAVLGIGSLQTCFRPDENGSPKLKHELGVTVSADHRVHTGVRVLEFLKLLENVFENPIELLL